MTSLTQFPSFRLQGIARVRIEEHHAGSHVHALFIEVHDTDGNSARFDFWPLWKGRLSIVHNLNTGEP
jgi:hypothetical protein